MLSCAVASCEEHSGNAIQEGYNVSFHKFPKDLKLQKFWAKKCEINGKWNPQSSYICSKHFSPNDFVKDMKAKLSGYVPSHRHLKQNIVPSLRLSSKSKTPNKCTSNRDAKTVQLVHDVLAKSFPPNISPEFVNALLPATPSNLSYNEGTINLTDYKKLYNDTLDECNMLKAENRLLKKKEKKKKMKKYWSREELTKSFGLLYHSEKAFAYIKEELHYNLPEHLAFQQWAKSLEMKTGLIKDVLGIMKLNSDKLHKIDKLTVLMFDEVNICNKTEYDVLNDELVGPHDQMQVVMAQSITSKWKQPIFFNVNEDITKAVLYDIIDKLDDIGFKVICCVTNCDIKNVELWNQLNLTYTNPTFFTPSGRKIVFIPDSSHLLQLTRNWFLGTGFCLNGAEINKKPLEALITKAPSEVCHCVKLKEEHLICEGPQQKNIKLTKELLSHYTATTLLHCGPIENFQLLHSTADFIKLISNWFDLVNVSVKHDNNEFKSPFGLFSYKQNKLLNKVYNTINSMRCKGSNFTNLQMFQKGILMHINGLKQLLQISEENGLDCLLTANINKDSLENILQQLSSIDDPSSFNAVKKLKMIILGIDHDESNIIDNNHEEYMFSQTFKSLNISLNDEDNKKENIEVTQKSDSDLMSENEFITTNIDKNENEIELDAIKFLAGLVALKYKSKIPEIGYMETLNNSDNSSGQNKMSSSMVRLPNNE
ncbi:Transposable element P transposase, partial [Aphis craccivora]